MATVNLIKGSKYYKPPVKPAKGGVFLNKLAALREAGYGLPYYRQRGTVYSFVVFVIGEMGQRDLVSRFIDKQRLIGLAAA